MDSGIKVCVVMGGWSPERSVSLRTGKAVSSALRANGFTTEEFDLRKKDKNKMDSVLSGIRKRNDLIFDALHGCFGEDGIFQAMLEAYGMPYTGSGVMASVIGMDKILTKKVFAECGIPTPEWQAIDKISDPVKLKVPLVVKPANSGSSVGVSIVFDEKKIIPAVKKAGKFGRNILVEKYISGREMTVAVLNGQPLPVVEIIAKKFNYRGQKFYDFKAKYSPGGSCHIVPAQLPHEKYRQVQAIAVGAYRAVGCSGVARVDLMLPEEGSPLVLEVNTIPGMTEVSLVPDAAKAAGVSFNELVRRIVNAGMDKG